MLADLFKSFSSKCLEIYKSNSAHFLSVSDLSWQGCLKKTNIELELTDLDMSLLVEKGIRGEMCHGIHRHAKTNNKYIKGYDPNKESSDLKYWDVNNLYDWVSFQKLPVNNFQKRNDKFNFYENFIRKSDKVYILYRLMLSIHFYLIK